MSWARRLRHLRPQPASLSSKVLWFTVIVILSMEMVILLFALGKLRQDWLVQRLDQAQLAVYALSQAHAPGAADNILTFAGLEKITLSVPRHPGMSWQISGFIPSRHPWVNPFQESLLRSAQRAVLRVAGMSPAQETIIVPSSLLPDATLRVTVSTTPLTQELVGFARHGFDFAVVVALLTGLLVYGVLNRLMVQPMEILTASIIRFREHPESADTSGLDWLAGKPKDDISTAARELRAMQDELRAALWRNGRLAAVGTAVAKIAHDLRNILSSALLMADRLQDIEDPVVKRATRALVPAVERAVQLVSGTVDFAREGPPPVTRSAVRLHDLIDEAALPLVPEDESWRVENHVPETLVLQLDRGQLYRVFNNLIRNAVEAGATLVSFNAERVNGQTRLRVADNGPGLPPKAQANLFKPFTGSVRSGGTGLGLTIARDLIRAHGGDLMLERTGPSGTIFSMELATHELTEFALRG